MKWEKLPDMTDYMGKWHKALAHLASLVFTTHLVSVALFNTEFLSVSNLMGSVIITILVAIIGYKQKRIKREKR